MKNLRAAGIQVRTPVFFGCEGLSEVGYAHFLNDLMAQAVNRCFLKIQPLSPGAGDPEQLVRRAIQILKHPKYKELKITKKLS